MLNLLFLGLSIAAAQAAGPCALLTTSDVQPLAAKASVADGVPKAVAAAGYSACQFSWGAGVDRYKLDVTVNDASRMFAGMAADQIKQGLQTTVAAGSADAVVPDVGDAAIFKADSAAYVHAMAFVKGRIVEVRLDGFDARDKKDQVIALLKSAASRL